MPVGEFSRWIESLLPNLKSQRETLFSFCFWETSLRVGEYFPLKHSLSLSLSLSAESHKERGFLLFFLNSFFLVRHFRGPSSGSLHYRFSLRHFPGFQVFLSTLTLLHCERFYFFIFIYFKLSKEMDLIFWGKFCGIWTPSARDFPFLLFGFAWKFNESWKILELSLLSCLLQLLNLLNNWKN